EGLTLDDIKLVFQYRRPAAIGILSRIGAELDDRTFCKAAWLAGHRMQFDQLKRRDFITLLGGAAAAWPLAALSPGAKFNYFGRDGQTAKDRARKRQDAAWLPLHHHRADWAQFRS